MAWTRSLLRRTRSRLLAPPAPPASQLMDHRKQQQHRSGASAASSAKNGGGGGKGSKQGTGGSGSGGKKPIKVVYISNPMRVKTNAAGFRALVQELTGRHADPSKYSSADEDTARQAELSPEGSAAASTTPDAAAAPGPAAAPDLAAAAFDGDEGDDDIFRSLDNDYAVFSPTLYYDYPHDGSSNKV